MDADIDLDERLRQLLADRDDVVEKRMFGGRCFMVRGHMLGGAMKGRYMFRVGKALHAEALQRPGASPMDFTGKPLGGFVYVDADACAQPAQLAEWIELALRFNRSLADRD